MKCEDAQTLLDGYADGELDLVNHLQVEQHVEVCEDCASRVKKTSNLSKALSDDVFYYRAPNELREKIRASLGPPEPEAAKEKWWKWRWLPALSAAAVAAVALATLLVFLPSTRSTDDVLASEVVSAHVRSMMIDNHLTDVPSTDQHTVKPWFDGKLDFAPPVIDLTPQGFVLIGGRLDYVAGRSVAALVYQRRQHKINLFIFPSGSNSSTQNQILVKQGYNVVHWDRSGMTFWAVSDLNLNELQEFAQDLQT
jgi:anti-sigma factor RsiW